MLEKLKEYCRKFKDTKVYNYKIHILTILVTIFLVVGVTAITVGGEEERETELSKTAVSWSYCTTTEPSSTTEVETESKTTTSSATSTTTTTLQTKKTTTTTTTIITQPTTVETSSKIVTTAQSKLIGRFKITVYCACSKCCGKSAYNRPVDANGNVIVKGASGRTLIPYYSIATDPRVIPSGTEVVINGKVYRADDTGGAVKGNVIDIYAGLNHDEAMQFAYAMESQYDNVYWN